MVYLERAEPAGQVSGPCGHTLFAGQSFHRSCHVDKRTLTFFLWVESGQGCGGWTHSLASLLLEGVG